MQETEYIVLLDEQHNPIGSAPKLASHHGNTPLHLAFSSYIFSRDGKLLVTRRADTKKVWPGVWTNTCCGHPAPGESMEAAIARRLEYELGLSATNLELIIPDYSYRTPPFHGIIENEFCPIYFAVSDADPVLNSEEVSAYKWMMWHAFVDEATAHETDVWSWWCKDQLQRLMTSDAAAHYLSRLSA